MNVICFSIVISIANMANIAEAYPILDPAINLYTDNIKFLENMMTQDSLWRPILEEKIKMIDLPRNHLDHFNVIAMTNETPRRITVDTFKEVIDLMMTNSKTGKHVAFVMKAVKNSLVCSILKHISLQGFLLHHLMLKVNHPDVIFHVIRWLDHMIIVSIDKLVAVNHRLPSLENMHSYVQNLIAKPNNYLEKNVIQKLSQDIYNELGDVCEILETTGNYETLILKLKESMTIEELDTVNSLLTNDNKNNIYELNKIASIKEYHGSLNIDDNIDPNGFETLNEDELKKILIINRIKMNSIFSKLPINALSELQWTNISHLNEPTTVK